MSYSTFLSKFIATPFLTVLTFMIILAGCSDNPSASNDEESGESIMLDVNEEYNFTGPVFDIAALPNGGILVADFADIKEITDEGVREITSLPMVEGPGAFGEPDITFINGLEPTGTDNFFATRSGLDLSVGAALFRTTEGNNSLVGDIEEFMLGDWPDGEAGFIPEWKNIECEPPGGFSEGPQTNPYHLTALSDSELLIADAAGNSLLYAKNNGQVEVVATFPPVVDPDTDVKLVLFPLNEDVDCPVEPVPTAVAVGDDGAYYVGELTGTTAENFGGERTPEGLASIWRVEAGSRDVSCPSAACTKVLTGLNSVIDIEFGPDGYLYVVEYEKNGFLATVAPDFGISLAGGAVKKCDLNSNNCDIIEGGASFEDLPIPGAITFDQSGNLWLVENVFDPTVRAVNID